MLEAYSTNETLLTNALIPFNSVTLKKGNTCALNGVSSIELNNCGVYEITLDITGTVSVAGAVSIECLKNGVIQPQATISVPLATTDNSINGSITTLVQVSSNNGNCCCQSPVVIQFNNTGVGLTTVKANVSVAKIC